MGMGCPTRVFFDANVWFSRTRRDWLGMLYVVPDDPPFQVFWTEDVLAELLSSLRDRHPGWDGGRITGIRDRLASTFEVGRVGDFKIDGSYLGRDPGDAHVHAAAVACGAQYLVTCNTKDFHWDQDESAYDVLHPDDFLMLVAETTPTVVHQVIREMSAYWFQRQGWSDLPRQLISAECPQFAARVRTYLQAMA